MKITFERLTIDNFLSFGHAEVDLKDRGYTLIEGINNNPKDGAKSNGAGKSTIFSALCYALTGETIQGLTSNLNNIITGQDMSVKLEFSVDKNDFIVIRSRDVKNHGDLKVIVNGIDKSGKGVRESQEVLENFLPDLTSDLIGEVIIVGQGMPHKFSNNTPSGRKDLLERLSHSDYMLEDIRERVEKRSESLKNKLRDITVEKTKKETSKFLIEESLKKKEEELLNYSNKPDFDGQISKISEDIKIINNQISSLTTYINNKNTELENVDIELGLLTNKKYKLLEDEAKVFNQHNIDIKSAIVEKKNNKKSLTEEIEKLKNIKDVCPLCNQKLPHVHKQDYSLQEKQLKQIEEDLKKLIEKDSKQEEAYNLNIQDIKDSFKDEENRLNANKSKLKEELKQKALEQKDLNNQLNNLKINLSNKINERDNFDRERNNCVNEINNLKNQLTAVTSEILYIIKEEQEVGKHQEVVNKMSTLIKRDFRGILLSSIISYIDKKCKVYAKDIFGTDNLDFKLDGNNITITYLNKPLESLSGGEQQKVDLILQFAIRSMMQEYTGFTSNIIVLDEILDNLDSLGCDAVLNFITNRLSDIESIFIISHHADTLNIGNDSTITVIKNKDGVSYIL